MTNPKAVRPTFRKPERLVSKRVFERLVVQGKSIHRSPIRFVYCPYTLNTVSPAQVAFSVPKRVFPRAVDRNRIKRLLRESYRLNKSSLYPLLEGTGNKWAILVVFTGKTVPRFEEVMEKFGLILQQLAKDLQSSAG